jgi:phospholipase C
MEIQMADVIRDIEAIVVVLMENRSFDHVLGYLGLPPFNLPIVGLQKFSTPSFQ